MLDLVRGSPPFKTDKELLQSFVMGPAAKVALQSMLMMHDHDAIQCSLKNAEKNAKCSKARSKVPKAWPRNCH